jgi:hypothetical protein
MKANGFGIGLLATLVRAGLDAAVAGRRVRCLQDMQPSSF